jgi:hypothetical protein
MRLLHNILIGVTFCSVIAGCHDDNNLPVEPLPDDVYIGGNLIDDDQERTACYWKGSSVNSYQHVEGGSHLTSLFVEGDNVYTTVLELERSKPMQEGPFGVCWINGETKVMLDDQQKPSSAGSIRASNGSVYVMGENNQSGVPMRYWKDDQYHAVDGGGLGFQTTGFYVENGNAFITGIQYSGFSEVVVKSFYSRNEKLVALSKEEPTTRDYSNGIYVLNDTAYVAGWESGNASASTAKYWINQQSFLLANGAGVVAEDIFVEGKDTHIIGNRSGDNVTPVYWKNNVMVELPVPDASGSTVANSVYAKNGDVYIAGTFSSTTASGQTSRGVYWVNGILKEVKSKSNFEFTQIFVAD